MALFSRLSLLFYFNSRTQDKAARIVINLEVG